MKSFFFLGLCFYFFSCKDHKHSTIAENTKDNPILSEVDLYRKAYDVADLKSYSDTMKFVGRFVITKKYNNTFYIEVDEIANGINLCVKQPVVYLPDFKFYDTIRSLPFNQLCYWYADEEADSIKKAFLNYSTGEIQSEIDCAKCLDTEDWIIEIYNKGKYSSLTKDHLKGNDSIFINMLYDKVKLYKNNNYTIKFD